MKLLAKDLSDGHDKAISAVDADSSGNITTTGLLKSIGNELTAQGSNPGASGPLLWSNSTGNVLTYFDGSTDYVVTTANTALGGDVTGTPGATVVGNDSHTHGNSTLTGVPGSAIDTTALHSGDATGGDLSGTYPTNLTVVEIQGTKLKSPLSPSDQQVLTWITANNQWEAKTSPAGVTTLAGLSDTNISSPSAGHLLLWDGSNSWDNKALSGDGTISSAGALSVTDLTISGEVTNDILQYSGSAWVAKGAVTGDKLAKLWGTSLDMSTEVAVGSNIKLQTNRLRFGAPSGQPIGGASGDLYYTSDGTGELYFVDDSASRKILHDNYSFIGDVTGTVGATVVGNDSHTHANGSLTQVPGAGIDTNVTNLRSYTVQNHAPLTGELLRYSGTQYEPTAQAGIDTAVTNLRGYSVQTGAPTTGDRLRWNGSSWQHDTGLEPDYTVTQQVDVNSSYALSHNLGVVPRLIICQVSANSNMNPSHLAGWGWMHGENTGANNRGTIICDVTTSAYTIRTGAFASPYGVFESYGFGGTRRNLGDNAYVRVSMWK